MPPRPLLAFDVIAKVVSLAPAPYLQPAVETFRIILSHVDQVQVNRRQIQAITETIAQILFVLHSYSPATLVDDRLMFKNCHEFERLLARISNLCAKIGQKSFLKSFLDAAEVQAEIDFMHTQLSLSVDSFQISSYVSIQNYHRRVEAARLDDQAEISTYLNQLHKTQDTILNVMGRPSAAASTLDSADDVAVKSQKTIFGLLGDIQETVKKPIDSKSCGSTLQEVLVELQKVSTARAQMSHVDQNPIAANLKPGLTADVLIAPLRWQMNTYMRKDRLTQHLDREQIGRFAKEAEGSKMFVEYLMVTDDLSFQYSALDVFRKDKSVKHFFRPE